MVRPVEEYLPEFAANMVGRLEKLEDHAHRVDQFLFEDTPERTSMATIARQVEQHISVLCAWARGARALLEWGAKLTRWVAIIMASLVAIWGAWSWLRVGGLAFAEEQRPIAEMQRESLWQFLMQLPASFEAQLFYAMVLGGAVGMLGNYTVRWLKKETGGWCFLKYLFHDHPKRTVLSFLTTVGTGMAAIAAGVFMTDAGEFVGWFNVLWIAVTNGFTFDVVTNKATRASWTEAERAARVGPGGQT